MWGAGPFIFRDVQSRPSPLTGRQARLPSLSPEACAPGPSSPPQLLPVPLIWERN